MLLSLRRPREQRLGYARRAGRERDLALFGLPCGGDTEDAAPSLRHAMARSLQ